MIFSRKKCKCEIYQPLELIREQITTRIKESKEIIKTLDKLADSKEGNTLYICSICGQFWQKSSAWNWGGKSYLFKVPEINTLNWLQEQFMSPADMLIYSALMTDYFEKTKLIETSQNCRKEDCDKNAIEGSVLCKEHFIENLQKIGNLPKRPSGKIFEPYSFKNE